MAAKLEAGVPADLVSSVRRFNRFYTRLVGALDEGHMSSPFPLAAVRVLYEVAHSPEATPTSLAADLRLDGGYLSRLLADLERQGLLDRAREGRGRTRLQLTAKGKRTFSALEARTRRDVARVLAPLREARRRQVAAAMETIESALGVANASAQASFILRPPHAGDFGWVVARHGALYAGEYDWDETFEGLVAQIVADFVRELDPRRERCWIAERDGENAGCVFLVKHPERAGAAKLRLLLVEPDARGLGIGRRLVEECTRFARAAKYERITLWTNSVLTAARRIYEAEGYALVKEEPHRSFGHDLVGQFWELPLAEPKG